MNQNLSAWGHLEKLAWRDVLIIAAVLILARLLILVVRWTLRRAAENAEPHRRLAILRISPILRLLIRGAAIVVIVPLLVEANRSQRSCAERWSRPGAGLYAQRLREQCRGWAGNSAGKHVSAR